MSQLIFIAIVLMSLITGFTGGRIVTALTTAASAAPTRIAVQVLLPGARCGGETLGGRRCLRSTTDVSGLCAAHHWQLGKALHQ